MMDMSTDRQTVKTSSRDTGAPANVKTKVSKLKQGIEAVGSKLRQLNLARLIDELEQDQEYAYHLEDLNKELREEQDRREMKREAEALCMATISQHLADFVCGHPAASYEEWIKELHPENSHNDEIDHRFFVQDSDHRKMWNDNLGGVRKYVPSRRLRQGVAGVEVVPDHSPLHEDAESIS